MPGRWAEHYSAVAPLTRRTGRMLPVPPEPAPSRPGGPMRIGVPKEVKNHEYRVAMTPAGVHELVVHGHDVLVEAGAGIGSSIPDEQYAEAGAKLVAAADDVWGDAEMVLKVKEPVKEEYHRMREGQGLDRKS